MSTITFTSSRERTPITRALLEQVVASPSLAEVAVHLQISEIWSSTTQFFGTTYDTFGVRVNDSYLQAARDPVAEFDWIAREIFRGLVSINIDLTPAMYIRQTLRVNGEEFQRSREISFTAGPMHPSGPNAFPRPSPSAG